MKIVKFIFLLSIFIVLNAQLNKHDLAQLLHLSEELAARMIERTSVIDQLNNYHASSYYPILCHKFLNNRNYKIGCEIGVFTGGHAEFILANSAIEKLYCVDPYISPTHFTNITEGFENSYWQACWDTIFFYTVEKLSKFGNRAQFIRLPASQAARKINNYSLDFVFIDGDHSYDAVLSDCTNYYNKVRSGGLIAGDDYGIDEVGQAVREFFQQKKLVINVYGEQQRFWAVEKP